MRLILTSIIAILFALAFTNVNAVTYTFQGVVTLYGNPVNDATVTLNYTVHDGERRYTSVQTIQGDYQIEVVANTQNDNIQSAQIECENRVHYFNMNQLSTTQPNIWNFELADIMVSYPWLKDQQ